MGGVSGGGDLPAVIVDFKGVHFGGVNSMEMLSLEQNDERYIE